MNRFENQFPYLHSNHGDVGDDDDGNDKSKYGNGNDFATGNDATL